MKKKENPFGQLYFLLFPFVAVVALGVIGYMFLGFTFIEALYMTVITLGSVGFTEVHPLDDTGRIFTILLIVLNLGLLAFVLSRITQHFLDGSFQKYLKDYRMNKSIRQLQNHVIICGFGRNGKAAAEMLLRSDTPFVVIERELQKIEASGITGLII